MMMTLFFRPFINLIDPTLFQPYLTDFFVFGKEPTFSRNIKLDILTLLANESNIDRY